MKPSMAAGYMDLESDQQGGPKPGLLREVRATKVYHIWVVITIYILCEILRARSGPTLDQIPDSEQDHHWPT